MNVRLNQENLTGAQQTGKTAPSAPVEKQRSGFISRTGGSDSDQVEISPLLERVGEALAAADTAHAGRVQELTKIYQSGRYQADSRQVSRALVSHALASEG